MVRQSSPLRHSPSSLRSPFATHPVKRSFLLAAQRPSAALPSFHDCSRNSTRCGRVAGSRPTRLRPDRAAMLTPSPGRSPDAGLVSLSRTDGGAPGHAFGPLRSVPRQGRAAVRWALVRPITPAVAERRSVGFFERPSSRCPLVSRPLPCGGASLPTHAVTPSIASPRASPLARAANLAHTVSLPLLDLALATVLPSRPSGREGKPCPQPILLRQA